jgi:hypothetical protein
LLDVFDDNSQTVTAGPSTERSRTPSPQKATVPPVSIPTKTNITPSNDQSSVYTFLPYTPSPSNSTNTIPVNQTSSLNIFAPKPFRSTASINLDTSNNHETVRISSLEIYPIIIPINPGYDIFAKRTTHFDGNLSILSHTSTLNA